MKFFTSRDKNDSKTLKIRMLEKENKIKESEIEHLNNQLRIDYQK